MDGAGSTDEEAVTTYTPPIAVTASDWTLPGGTSQAGMRAEVKEPDQTYNRIYFIGIAGTSSGWQRGLPALVNTYDSLNALQRQAVTTWTQDNPSVSYPLNPRVTETNIYDPAGNRVRTTIGYKQFTLSDGTSCQLPQDFFEYQANATTVLRRSH